MLLASRVLVSLTSLAVAAVGVVALAPVAPVSAASTTLCSGWSGCVAKGFSDAGYGASSKNSYWRMYSGHNCTNYVAYRMIQAGMPAERPFAGTGNAWNWGVQMASKTDQVPSVGAVAWWNKGVSGAGSVGHVAYVEQVLSPTEIVVSEDSWGGDFKWRKITVGSGWPSGFIHLTDQAIANTSPATITGTPAVGQTVTAGAGGWAPAAGYAYQWLLDGQPLAGATSPSLALTSVHAGKTLGLRVTASLAGWASATSEAAGVPVALGALTPSGAPTVDGGGTGRLLAGAVLTAGRVDFSPTPRAVSVQWTADGAPIPGATDWSYTVGADQVGRTIAPVVTGRRPGFAPTPVAGTARGPVLGGVVEIAEPHVVTGKVRVGGTLSVGGGRLSPADATTSYTWLRDGAPVDGAQGASYTLTEADAGRAVAVRVTVAKPGWAGRSRTVAVDERVAADPTITLKTAGRRSAAVVWFRVDAPGGRPDGTAVVSVGELRRTVSVRRGVGRLVVRGLRPGGRDVAVRFAGADGVRPGQATGRVRVGR